MRSVDSMVHDFWFHAGGAVYGFAAAIATSAGIDLSVIILPTGALTAAAVVGLLAARRVR
jgi:hypothetical protein